MCKCQRGRTEKTTDPTVQYKTLVFFLNLQISETRSYSITGKCFDSTHEMTSQHKSYTFTEIPSNTSFYRSVISKNNFTNNLIISSFLKVYMRPFISKVFLCMHIRLGKQEQILMKCHSLQHCPFNLLLLIKVYQLFIVVSIVSGKVHHFNAEFIGEKQELLFVYFESF